MDTSRNDWKSKGNGNGDDAPAAAAMANRAHEFVDRAAQRAGRAEEQLKTTAHTLGEKADAARDGARQGVEQAASGLQRMLREQPVACAALAFAAGVVATSLLRR